MPNIDPVAVQESDWARRIGKAVLKRRNEER